MDLHDLLEQKSFEELEEREQAFVLDQMTQEDYEIERGTILASQAFFMSEELQITPNPMAANSALLALEKRREKKTLGLLFLAYKIPAWQAVAAAMVIFLLTNHFGGGTTAAETNLLAQKNTRDTVFVDKYITKIQPADTVVKVIYKVLTGQSTPKRKEPEVLASNGLSKNKESQVVETEAVSREFNDVLQYCSRSSSRPASKDTFLQLLSNEVLF